MIAPQNCRPVAMSVATLLVVVGLVTADSLAVQESDEWSEAVHLGPIVNSEFNDTYPAISKNGLSLYFASNRPGSVGGVANVDMWVSRRTSVRHAWQPPVNLGLNLNSEFLEDAPALSRDGHWLFFDSTRPGGEGGLDHWVSWRAHIHDDFGWLPAVNLGTVINTSFVDAGPAPFANARIGIPELYFVSNRPGGPGLNDIYVSRLTEFGHYGEAALVAGLSSPQGEFRPTIRRDGLEIVFASNRPGTVAGPSLWVSHRASVHHPWSAPEEVGPMINTGSFEGAPYFSGDGRSLYLHAARPDTIGGLDLYVSARPNHQGRWPTGRLR